MDPRRGWRFPREETILRKAFQTPWNGCRFLIWISATLFRFLIQQVAGIRLARVDQRMIKLRHLASLDLSSNEISKLPENWDQVPCLRELNLAENQLTTLPRRFCTGALSKSLCQLNLSSNLIELLPNFTCSLVGLLDLNLAKNKLRALPPAFARFRLLHHLDASHNLLTLLPGGLARLKLDSLELTGNNFSAQEPRVVRNRWIILDFQISSTSGSD